VKLVWWLARIGTMCQPDLPAGEGYIPWRRESIPLQRSPILVVLVITVLSLSVFQSVLQVLLPKEKKMAL
jgi:hypothetical protein